MKLLSKLALCKMAVFCAFCALSEPVVVVTEHLSPYQVVEADGTITGIHTTLIRETFDEANIPYQIFSNEWSVSFQQALKDPNVCIYSMVRIPQREDRFAWIGELSTKQGYFYSRADSGITLRSFEDAKKYRVAAIKGDASLLYLKAKGFVEYENLYPLENYHSLLSLLEKRSDSIDLVLLNDVLLKNRRENSAKPIHYVKHDNFVAMELDFHLACHIDADPQRVERLRRALPIAKQRHP